jgi:hypothetical protein
MQSIKKALCKFYKGPFMLNVSYLLDPVYLGPLGGFSSVPPLILLRFFTVLALKFFKDFIILFFMCETNITTVI